MVNKYWDPKYKDLINRVEAWNALEGGFYHNKQLRGYNNYKWYDLSEAQIEAQIEKAQADFKEYFYCPRCGRKSHIAEAIVKRKIISSSFKLDNAAMPGWMKIKASSESCYIRLCPECAEKTGNISLKEYIRAYDGNAIENRKGKIRAAENSGCMVIAGAIITIASAACWIVCLII